VTLLKTAAVYILRHYVTARFKISQRVTSHNNQAISGYYVLYKVSVLSLIANDFACYKVKASSRNVPVAV